MLAFATKDPITKIASHKYFILYQPPLKIIEDFINSSHVTLVPRIHRVKDSFIITTDYGNPMSTRSQKSQILWPVRQIGRIVCDVF